ncbi:pyridoxal-phosphate dependent enzyme [Paenibacillus sp. GCM10027626]|uniref:threonine synthase n=1 Tax=Paenibacillus sp. GCM10027626 TaxID=3273411 RepID=UPI0036457CA1
MLRSINTDGIWAYSDHLPAVAEHNRVSLGEGQSPLVKSVRIGQELGLPNLYFKLESLNPTGSYKDRISAMAVSLAKEHGSKGCVGTTSGNAGGSIAAYAARAGVKYHVYVQENIVASKLEPMIVHQADIIRVKDFGFEPEVGNRVFRKVLENAEQHNWELAITAYAFAPLAMEAVKTIAYEVAERLTADAVFIPVGGGGLLTGIYKGYADLVQETAMKQLPKLIACQSTGCANVANAWKQGLTEPAAGASTAKISGIQVPNPPDGAQALQALRASGGFAEAVPDEDTWYWQEQLAVKEGIFCEPAGAIALASAVQALKAGRIAADEQIVCLVSGAGYKDADRMSAIVKKAAEVPLKTVDEL